ncbi:hypothetical protein [Candidatus Laterigemmans baculatus]|uniref:hypothetical protein n=1 Tax=Candidatus Laterigemmans baculatus TaxID=2770505 RepID=UPI0013D99877|nr:hypothetical protein [Candidatus Laterigemmans baculatus]
MALALRSSALGLALLGAGLAAVPLAAETAPSTSRSEVVLDPAWERRSGPSEIWPPGWKKEEGVWKRIDGTPLPVADPGKTINDLIRRQEELESAGQGTWLLATLMVYLRALDPITLASAQISAFCLLAYRVMRRE